MHTVTRESATTMQRAPRFGRWWHAAYALLPVLLAVAVVPAIAVRAAPVPEAKLVVSDATTDSSFGASVAMSGDTAVIGAFGDRGRAGAAYIFTRSGVAWTQQAKLTASDAAAGDAFGWAVAISGETVVVGAPYRNGDTGAAYVFTRAGNAWTEQARLTASGGAAGDQFGQSVAVSGETAAIGASGTHGGAGAVSIFIRSGTGSPAIWQAQTTLIADDATGNESFGITVALSGDTAAVGASGRGEGAGAVYVFTRSGDTMIWASQQVLVASDASADDQFGMALALRGDTVAVGASGKGGDTGAAYVFTRSGNGVPRAVWTQQAKLAASDEARRDKFGSDITVNGDTVMVGAPGKGGNTGVVYLFTRDEGMWMQQAKLAADDPMADDQFGIAVASGGDTVLVGAYAKDDNTGAAYVLVPGGG